MTLLEVLVGLSIGLMVIAVALTMLQISNGVATNIHDATALQQDANHALRIMGQQIRQAGAVELHMNMDLTSDSAATAYSPVAFDPAVDRKGLRTTFDKATQTISSPAVTGATGHTIKIGFQNYWEDLYSSSGQSVSESQLRDCLGQSSVNNTSTQVTSTFFVRNNQLMCAGVTDSPQPIIGNVADFRINYLAQLPASVKSGNPTTRIVSAAAINGADIQWSNVFAIEICIELSGETARTNTAGATYTRCDGKTVNRGNQLRLVHRNTYFLRSQGITS